MGKKITGARMYAGGAAARADCSVHSRKPKIRGYDEMPVAVWVAVPAGAALGASASVSQAGGWSVSERAGEEGEFRPLVPITQMLG